jgi:hypothetical protein
MPLPSKIDFTSFLQYSPRGNTEACKRGRRYRDSIKNDSSLLFKEGNRLVAKRGIDFFAWQIAKATPQYPVLAVLRSDTVLVPIPRSAPLRQADALWPSRRICEALMAQGLGGEIAPILQRRTAVQKSATAPPGQRPGPKEHFDSTSVISDLPLLSGRPIVLVDDFITRGATFLGMYPHVQDAYPDNTVSCFALVRTMSYIEITSVLAPVQGTIENHYGNPSRNP